MKLSRSVLPLAVAAAFGSGLVADRAFADQPYMQTALGQLGEARATLAAGRTDKGGHRVRAIAAVDRAIVEVREGMRYAGY